MVEGAVQLTCEMDSLRLKAGQFCLLPAALPQSTVANGAPATFLTITL
jgi:hypothetical protein